MENHSFGALNSIIGYSKVNLSELVVSHIKNKILAGDLKSGDRLVETDISEELQISRAPIREAIRELNIQGILSFSPRKGSQVLDLSYEDIVELFSIRIPLEKQVYEIIFENRLFSEEDLEYLDHLNHEMLVMDSTITDPREKVFMLSSKDLEFHRYFWTKSKSMRRATILEGMFFQLLIAMNQDISTLGSTEEKFREHQQIITAFRSGKLEDTLKAFDKHMESYLAAISNLS